MDDAELQAYEDAAKAAGLTVSGWVRQALRKAERDVTGADVDARLTAIRRAAIHSFPAPDIEQMLAETERGYLSDRP